MAWLAELSQVPLTASGTTTASVSNGYASRFLISPSWFMEAYAISLVLVLGLTLWSYLSMSQPFPR